MTRNLKIISRWPKKENGKDRRTFLRSVTAAAIVALTVPLLSTASNASASTYVSPYLGSQLVAGEAMGPGQYLLSPSRNYELIMQQGDGNLVEYNTSTGTSTPPAVWDPPPGGLTTMSPGPAGHANSYAELQSSDGNFVILAASGTPLWASSTSGHPGDVLKLQDDGNIVIYASPAVGAPALWATNSNVTFSNGNHDEQADRSNKDGYTPGQCTYWAELEAKEYIGYWPRFVPTSGGDAREWAIDAGGQGWKVDHIPHIGSVIVFQPGYDNASSDGHVGWVTRVDPSSHTVWFTQMNVPVGNSQVTPGVITDGFGNPGISYIYLNP